MSYSEYWQYKEIENFMWELILDFCIGVWEKIKGLFHKHLWIEIQYDTYPQNERICTRCFKHEELVYDFLCPYWSEIK